MTEDQQIKIMIYAVDDDELWRHFIRISLEECGVSEKDFKIFSDPKELLAAWNDDVYLCIVDYYLTAGMNGLELIREVHNRNKICFMVLLSSAIPDKEVIKAFNQNDIDRYVCKGDDDASLQLHCAIEKGVSRINGWIEKTKTLIDRSKRLAETTGHVKNDNP